MRSHNKSGGQISYFHCTLCSKGLESCHIWYCSCKVMHALCNEKWFLSINRMKGRCAYVLQLPTRLSMMSSAPAKNVSGTNFSDTDSLRVPQRGPFNIRAGWKFQLSYNFPLIAWQTVSCIVGQPQCCQEDLVHETTRYTSLEVLNRLQTDILHNFGPIAWNQLGLKTNFELM